MKQAVSYLRVSGKGQLRGDGFRRQRRAVEHFAKANRLKVIEEYREEGVSGTKGLDQHPALTKLFARILSNGVRMVLVEKADRLARDLVEGELILREFRRSGVQVVECENGNDLTIGGDDNATGKLIRQVLGAAAEFEKSALVAKLRAARLRRRREDGRCEGRKPYGTKPGEAEVLDLMWRLHRKPRGGPRRSFGAIAGELNRRGLTSRTGKEWHRVTVWRILQRRRSPAP